MRSSLDASQLRDGRSGAAPRPAAWRPLTRELDDPTGPVRRLLDEAFPCVPSVQASYRDQVGPIQVDGARGNPGTVGTAFDVWLGLQVTPRPTMDLARRGARRISQPLAAAVDQMLELLGGQELCCEDAVQALGPAPAPERGDGSCCGCVGRSPG